MGSDLYQKLGIERNASQDDIKKAFRTKAMQYHPDKNKEDDASQKFKEINEAYSVLSDPSQKVHYDQFGEVRPDGGGGGHGPDLSDILKNMFGGGGGMPGMPGMSGMQGLHEMPGGFSFSFSQDDEPPNIFNMFGGGGPRRQQMPIDVVEVGIDINDIYYGNNKRVEFEMLELCESCNGCGAQDPSFVIKCMTCKGDGNIIQQMGPFIQKNQCPSCSGNGTTVKNNKTCAKCKGGKTVFNKKVFDLKLPKGVPNNYEVKMDKRGSYDPNHKKNKDIIFKFRYQIGEPYQLDEHLNVIYNLSITIEDLLAGFVKTIKVYKDDMTIKSDKYFNPNKPFTIKGQGIFNSKKNKNADLILKFKIEFTDGERLSKYNDVMQKVLKKEKDESDASNVVDLSTL